MQRPIHRIMPERTLLLFFVFVSSLQGCISTPIPKVSCLIINLEFVNCTWNEHGSPEANYTFDSSFVGKNEKCPSYLQENGLIVGCRLPYKKPQRFHKLNTRLFRDNGSVVNQQDHYLKEMVKLNPPFNLSVVAGKLDLWVYWNISFPGNPTCLEYVVRHRTNNHEWQSPPHPLSGGQKSFTLNFPVSDRRYEIQVKVRISTTCAESKFWSEWSQPVFWGSIKNDTDTRPGTSVPLTALYTGVAVVVLVILTCLLVRSERLRVILIPIVPNPGKNFVGLIDDYDGNVEKWLCISKEQQEGFKPNFIERTCPVREYKVVSQASGDSDSESALSIPTDQSDCLSMSSYSSSSTLPASTEKTQATPTPPTPSAPKPAALE